MADVLSCYGPDLDALADSAGEVKPFDAVSWEAWFGERWRSFADVIGFRSQADQLIHTAIVTKGQFGSIKTVLANGLADWIEKQPAAANPNAATRAKLDKVRAQAIEGWRSSLPGIWIVTAQPDGVPGRGCVGDVRAFSSPNAATYYEDQRGQELTARGPCEWNQPIRVHLAMWPWYAGNNLGVRAPGLAWRRSADSSPIYEAARVMQAPWLPEGNAAIHGVVVYEHYLRFRSATAPLLGGMSSTPQRPGELYRDAAGYVRVYLRTPTSEHLNGPLGPISVVAYNQVLSRFAAFFALRRALLHDVKAIPDAIRKILEANPDPCVKKFIATPAKLGTLGG